MAQANTVVKELRTVDETAVAPVVLPDAGVSMFERLARDPNCDPDKLERLMALYERAETMRAEAAFNDAMSAAQEALRPVAADAENPQTRSRYASYTALDRAVRPIYTKHGFALSFDTADSPLDGHIRIACYVTRSGLKRTYHVDMPADGKGAKGGDVMTKTHAAGAALSYGQRYLLKLIFNIAVGEDRDGNAPGNVPQATTSQNTGTPPEGFEQQWLDLEVLAAEGWPRVESAWAACNGAFKNFVSKHRKEQWNALKAKALAVKSR